MRRVDMTGLLERRVAVAVIFAETRLRFQRPSVLDSSATCAAAAVAPRRPRANGGHHSRCEQAQSSGRPIVCEPSSSTAPTAWEGRSHTRKHAHADSAEDSLITTIFPRIYARTYYAHLCARVMSFSSQK